MFEKYYPTEEQLFSLYRFLTFLKNDQMYWFEITLSSSTIKIKVEPPKGEIDIRIFFIYEDGRVDDDGFREQL